MLYKTFKLLFYLTTKAYFRSITIQGQSTIPDNKTPVIFAANHPSSFMDPILLAVQIKRPLYFLARGDIFKNKIVRRIFDIFHMIPIYTADLSKGQLHKNESTFDKCHDHLAENKTILIFPEGISKTERRLRPIKTGTARIALGAEEKHNFNLGLSIVPVGLNYSDPHLFKSDVFLNFGDPILVSDFKNDFLIDPRETVLQLTERLKTNLEKRIVVIENEQLEQIIEQIETLYRSTLRNENAEEEKGTQDFHLSQDIVKAVEYFAEHSPETLKNFEKKIKSYIEDLERSQLRDTQIRSSSISLKVFQQVVYFTIGFPFFLFGFLTNFIPFKLSGIISNRIRIREDFVGAIKIAIGLFTFLIVYCVEAFAFGSYTDMLWGALFFICLYPTGLFTIDYIKSYYKASSTFNYLRLFIRKGDLVIRLKTRRQELIDELEKRKVEYLEGLES